MSEHMNSSISRNEELGEWTDLGQQLLRRTRQPWKHVSLIGFLLIAIIGFGGMGIWVEIIKITKADEYRGTNELFIAVATFYPALIGSSSLQLILASVDNSNKLLIAFAIAVWVTSTLVGILTAMYYNVSPDLCLVIAGIMVVFAVWLWMITNADDPIYKRARIDSASGGSTGRQLKGDTSGFKVNS